MSELANKNNNKLWGEVKGYIYMLLGCVAYALSTSLFLAPNSIVAGGITGLAVVVNYLLPFLKVGVVSIALNIPILIFGVKFQGWKFIIRCFITIASLGLITDLIEVINVDIRGVDDYGRALPIVSDYVLASVYGGICQGVGIGLFVRYQFSSGGTELLGRIINHFVRSVSIPVFIGVLDGAVVLLGTIVTANVQNLFYALVVIFLSTKVSEIVLVGLEKSKLCIIISDKGEEISQTLIAKSPRGVTMLDGKGMYTHKEHQVLLTCVKNFQLVPLKKMVYEVDPKAFIIVNESVEVRGQGFKALSEDIDETVKKEIKNKIESEENKQI